MKKDFLEQLKYLQKINIPKYIDVRVQEAALKHLELPDMGKLRDRMEGQLYLDKLKHDIFAEYAFENIVGLRKFDWEKRDLKTYKRKSYSFGGKKLNLITFNEDSFPKLSSNHISNCVFIYVNPELFVFVSGLASKSHINRIAELNCSNIIEVRDFKNLRNFASMEELESLLE